MPPVEAADELPAAEDEDDVLREAVVVWLASSCASRAFAGASVSCADVTSASREVVSNLASGCPASTCSPWRTATLATVPDIGKLTSARPDGATVPGLDSHCSTSPTVAVASR